MVRLLCLVSLFLYHNSFARVLPKYEGGLFMGAFKAPHYPGADQTQQRFLGLPYMMYRGETIKVDDEGMRSEFVKKQHFKVDLSVAAAFPANSRDNKAREDMPNLDWLGEIGPRFRYFFIPYRTSLYHLELALQLRGVYSTDFRSVSHRGYVIHPILSFWKREIFFKWLTFEVRYGAIWATEKVMDYFYDVDSQYVRSGRDRYNAKAGFFEQHLDTAIEIRPYRRIRIFLGMQNNNYLGATNENSPLMKQKLTQSYAFGIMWNLYQSDEKVQYK